MGKRVRIGLLGAGRIGRLHGENLAHAVPEAELYAVADPYLNDEGRAWAKEMGIEKAYTDPEEIFNDKSIEAVFICSSTNTHADFIIRAAAAGKHIFCEKPIDTNLTKIQEALDVVKKAGVKLQVGFVRRFDHNHKAVADAVKNGVIGDPHIVIVNSRDPEPPPASYVAVSGGIFYDMMIHDFDMVRYVTGSEAVEVSSVGACLVNPNLQEESGIPDVDTAVVTMKMENGCIAVISNSRQAVYGYDQRVEAFGSKGMAADSNDLLHTAAITTVDGTRTEKPLWFFLERYNNAFIEEAKEFIDCVVNGKEPSVTGFDGLAPVRIAMAAKKSLEEGRPVRLDEIK